MEPANNDIPVGVRMGGKPSGSVQPHGHGSYRLVYQPQRGLNYKVDFSRQNYENTATQLAAATKMRDMLSLAYGRTRNRYSAEDDQRGQRYLQVDLNDGEHTICDLNVLDKINEWIWHRFRSHGLMYARATTGLDTHIFMHHLVLERAGMWPPPDPTLVVDHIDGALLSLPE
jgi:hypothetical protein